MMNIPRVTKSLVTFVLGFPGPRAMSLSWLRAVLSMLSVSLDDLIWVFSQVKIGIPGFQTLKAPGMYPANDACLHLQVDGVAR